MKPSQLVLAGIIAISTSFSFAKSSDAKDLSDKQIKHVLMQESLASYTGKCPCPENRDRAGHRCGKRSAYSRPGGASPLCYESDVTPAMIKQYKKIH